MYVYFYFQSIKFSWARHNCDMFYLLYLIVLSICYEERGSAISVSLWKTWVVRCLKAIIRHISHHVFRRDSELNQHQTQPVYLQWEEDVIKVNWKYSCELLFAACAFYIIKMNSCIFKYQYHLYYLPLLWIDTLVNAAKVVVLQCPSSARFLHLILLHYYYDSTTLTNWWFLLRQRHGRFRKKYRCGNVLRIKTGLL